MIIVAGLPRSGTSMMMHMLDAGGLDCVRDNKEGHFEHYEHERAIEGNWTEQDLYEWRHKAVKILLSHVQNLPSDCDYQVIIMRRNFEAIRKSAALLLVDTSTWWDDLHDIQSWAKYYPHAEVWYEDVLRNPLYESVRVAQLVNDQLDIDKMAGIVRRNICISESM